MKTKKCIFSQIICGQQKLCDYIPSFHYKEIYSIFASKYIFEWQNKFESGVGQKRFPKVYTQASIVLVWVPWSMLLSFTHLCHIILLDC